MLRASATSFSSSLTIFLFHMPRSSTHPMPNSRDATSQARLKSCEISSLMTEMRNGELTPGGGVNLDAALAVVMATIPTRNSRRGNWKDISGSWPAQDLDLHGSRQRRCKQIYTIETFQR